MDIVKDAFSGDSTIEQDDFKVFLDPQANAMLMDTTIDFNDMQGFVLNNLQQSSSCGSSCSC
ncbi:hypothetical protein BMS3Abin07_01744 [bacterium BMS3Abin07]|nr:hypothetical protein BMS3Abin07_01744 [bacterium BMS3Abin07]GBE32696.1 hypothetical protein BMS3Bbin05_01613 [bacterium BMS3Bbin05]HDO22088.1 hypothetical protein [Nitrospirota bacterium]HDZ88396.1 hypothetical protein [Nitrospirota bacterium]